MREGWRIGECPVEEFNRSGELGSLNAECYGADMVVEISEKEELAEHYCCCCCRGIARCSDGAVGLS